MHVRDLIQFLGELSENNNRAWFVMNKPRYDILRAEFLDVVIRLIADLSRFDPEVAGCNPKKALFRINRDLRFSREKIPYKTTFSAAITASGLKKPSQGGGPAYYFHIDADGKLLIAGGEYMPPPDRLRAIRQQVIADPTGFGKMLKNRKLRETFGDLQQEGKLTRPPKGFDADGPHAEYVKLKSFIVWNEVSLKKKPPADLNKHLATTFKDAYPLVTWLRQVN
ncbi:MAG TPA: DUF2461 domain-containing protein [Noviherbaspirillum sp.]|jgi:uncharacterized protein (TIGR02453 family)|uniref:DUF2461 domain-containing protein n=1 Tax=Noviherbaspirillum sp. TaxID=1926288 RepID=UPI002DDDA4D7|nr:DUF2461 domain-containing protein [Noviherbaspirillum sp.]HEV2609002.1 DUF2461 domain-containing protein [Noviherbaspirillum sp.]